MRQGERFGSAVVELHTLPSLHAPSGKIVACDPFTVEGNVLARKVPAGSYPVVLSVATFPTSPNGKDKGDQRVAAAFVTLRDEPVATWRIADFAEGARDGRAAAYRIEALTGSFMDARAHRAILREPPYWPTPSFTALEHQLLTEHFTPTWSWAVYQPDPRTTANCVAFMSGWGEGDYVSYWGLDAGGAPAVLLTDFAVFTDDAWAV